MDRRLQSGWGDTVAPSLPFVGRHPCCLCHKEDMVKTIHGVLWFPVHVPTHKLPTSPALPATSFWLLSHGILPSPR